MGTTLLAACGAESGAGSDSIRSAADITGIDWLPQKVTVDGKEYVLPKDVETFNDAHITFKPDPDASREDGGESGGSVGCNSFGADAAIDGDTVRITDLVQTLIGCPDPLGEFEEKFVGVFQNTLRATVEERDGARILTLATRDGDSITLREKTAPALKGTRWVMDKKAYLTLGRDDTVTGSLGCNTFRGEAVVKDGTIEFGPLATTRMTCAPAVMKTERELAGILSGKVSYQQKRDSLILRGASGDSVTARAE
ncbi:META domain-containing protein [Streptomyces sp. NPDC047072]|uniref:META domain-containing protein n=1 Tax=Streptomyces sp. NPDC047072 TaxID=3154809 RepID=UPI0033F8E0C3